jgi:hypothetical protein
MKVPMILFLLSLLGVAVFWISPDAMLLALVSAVASGVLLLLAWRNPKARAKPDRPRDWVVIDGSNVMYWKDGTPQIATVQAVARAVEAAGLTPAVVFDANAGYLLEDRYLHDHALAQRLGVAEARVLVVPKGVQADPYILKTAREVGGRVVSNDRFRDWAADYPEVGLGGHVIAGGYRDGAVWLNLPAA